MNIRELKQALEGLDETMEVKVRVQLDPSLDDDMDAFEDAEDVLGEYAIVADERSVSVEYGDLVIIGDLRPEE